jgi:hypothetical protein
MQRLLIAILLSAAFTAQAEDRPLNFTNDIVPIFTKAGCNAGGCHGKSGGQNGFKLSLLGFEPAEDYEHIVKEARGRRVFPAAPEQSLLLTKAVNATPHGGGKKLDAKSEDYALLQKWIATGMPFGKDTDPKMVSIEVQPRQQVMTLKSEQQLKVLAKYSDGYVRDVTRSALYEPNDKSMAETTEEGLVKLYDLPGEVSVMVRYQGQVAVFMATAPLGAPVDKLPPSANFVDDIVFAKLKQLGLPPSEVADDNTFIRRVTVDVAGRLPTPAEVDAFLSDGSPKKREALVDRLLASDEYADYFAGKWSALLRNKRVDPRDARGNFAFHRWIRDSLAENVPCRFMARTLFSQAVTRSSKWTSSPRCTYMRCTSRRNSGTLSSISSSVNAWSAPYCLTAPSGPARRPFQISMVLSRRGTNRTKLCAPWPLMIRARLPGSSNPVR